MRKTICIALLAITGLANAQAYNGAGDLKFNLGANIQNSGTGMIASADFGFGENISFGLLGSYLLSTVKNGDEKAKFIDRADIKARFNANLGAVIGLDSKMDVYPGLDLGLRNLGTHLGFRYFFSDGFGVFSEAGLPIAKYKTNPVGFENYNNQFYINIGASFNL